MSNSFIRIDDECHDVCSSDGSLTSQDTPIFDVCMLDLPRSSDTGSIDEDIVVSVMMKLGIDTVTGSTGHVSDHDAVFPADRIDERRFSDIWASDDGDFDRSFFGFFDFLCSGFFEKCRYIPPQLSESSAVRDGDGNRLTESEREELVSLGSSQIVVGLIGDEDDRLFGATEDLGDFEVFTCHVRVLHDQYQKIALFYGSLGSGADIFEDFVF